MRHQLCPVYFRHNYGRDRDQKRLQTEKALAYKSELLSAMTLCTEKLLNSKDIDAILLSISYHGNATKSNRVYYYENDSSIKLNKSKYPMVLIILI
jgi:hypothetical protein